MKTYKIIVSYRTGDSYGYSDEETELGLEWDSLDTAKENLKRIKEHYLWFRSINQNSCCGDQEELPKPKWLPDNIKYEGVIVLKANSGKDCQFSAYWCGYFETLYGAKIIPQDDEMSFEI